MVQTLNKWGNSLGLRIPKSLARENNLVVGDEIQLVSSNEGILIKPKKKDMTAQELLDSIQDDYKMEDLIPGIVGSEEW